MARMRARRSRTFVWGLTVLAAAGASWWWYSSGAANKQLETSPAAPVARVESPTGYRATLDPSPDAALLLTATMPAAPSSAPATAPASRLSSPADPPEPVAAVLAEAQAALSAGQTVKARELLSRAVDPAAGSAANDQAVKILEGLADEALWSPRIWPDDPLVGNHTILQGQTLLQIARRHKVTARLLADVNRIRNPHLIQQNQNLKVIHGPFRAVVCKSRFRMYLYCQDALVKVAPVGLGAEDTTPTGLWKIATKLENPTYYDPRGGKVIAADDPTNPLGEFWLGLEGVQGEALGQERYGIHGTVEPESIGRNVSLGCIRLLNPDAAFVYKLLIPGESTVRVIE